MKTESEPLKRAYLPALKVARRYPFLLVLEVGHALNPSSPLGLRKRCLLFRRSSPLVHGRNRA
jgi:hypothetical protein